MPIESDRQTAKQELEQAMKDSGEEVIESETEDALPEEEDVDAQPVEEAEAEQDGEEPKEEDAVEKTEKPDQKSVIEEIALEMGWQDKESYESNPNNKERPWVDAEQYVRNMKAVSESHRKSQRDLQKQLDEATKAISKLVSKQEAAEKRAAEADKQARKNLLKELEDKLDDAAEEGNKQAVRDLTKQIATLSGELNQPEVESAVEDVEDEVDEPDTPDANAPAAVARWMGRNEKTDDNPDGWYNDTDDPINAALTLYADKRSAELGHEHDSWQEIFNVLDPEIRQRRADLQARMAPEKPKRDSSPAGGGRPPGNTKKTFNDLTSAEKRAARAFVKKGAFKSVQHYIDSME